ncbi:hypothetical protein QCA50_019464 [Cerrena zonata]|uniref:Uncharacterized protein n=1 Tax=Cerrena zonata TaxID=2478898 RepID=A0AAW0FES3_9APHY
MQRAGVSLLNITRNKSESVTGLTKPELEQNPIAEQAPNRAEPWSQTQESRAEVIARHPQRFIQKELESQPRPYAAIDLIAQEPVRYLTHEEALTFFCYPIFCYTIGIESLRSIGFIGRLVTLALGTPLINALGGSVSLMAVCTILSGICGVLIGDSIFNFLRVPTNDYVTRGVTLGINCGAIATAHLLNIDPRAASMSSLSFSIFGTVMVIMASIGAIRLLIQSWVVALLEDS